MSARAEMSTTPLAAPARRIRFESAALVVWVALACIAMFTYRTPPAPPPVTPQESAQQARVSGFVVRDAAEWQREEGDLTIPWDEAEGQLVIVIDDVGRELEVHDKLQSLRFPLTFSVLPNAVYTAGAQLRLADDPRRYREVWLHLPMEPLDARDMQVGRELEERFLMTSDSPAVLRDKTLDALARVPAAIGVNNHMGSRFTTDPAALGPVMDVLAERGLAFVDSRTNAETVAESVARERGVRAASRKVFLDHESDPAAVRAKVIEAIDRARTEPTIAIGHPNVATYEALEELLPAAHEAGIGVYPLSELLRRAPNASP